MWMLQLPQRNDLVAQTAKIVRGEIARGHWADLLPSERKLCALLKISRPTLRSALRQLIDKRVVKPVERSGYRIIGRRPPADRSLDVVHLLSPDPLERLRHQSQFWIAELRQTLMQSGRELRIHHGSHFLRKGASRSLSQLLKQQPAGCWVLAHSTHQVQQWFLEQGTPTMLAGLPHPDIALPSVQIDVEAVCRHAVGVLARAGHQNTAFLIEETDRAGDIASIRGYEQGTADHHFEARTVRYRSDEPAALDQATRRLLRDRCPPTALLIGNALAYATVSTLLLRAGIRIPQDISLICREDDNFLPFLHPVPAYYAYSPIWYAAKIHDHLRRLLTGHPASSQPVRIVPDFHNGESVGKPAAIPRRLPAV